VDRKGDSLNIYLANINSTSIASYSNYF